MEYYSINDAARMIGVSERTVRNWISVGKIKTTVVSSNDLSCRKRGHGSAVTALNSSQIERERARLAKASLAKQELSREDSAIHLENP